MAKRTPVHNETHSATAVTRNNPPPRNIPVAVNNPATANTFQEIRKIPKPEGVPGLSEENGGFNVQAAAGVTSTHIWNRFIVSEGPLLTLLSADLLRHFRVSCTVLPTGQTLTSM